jgi:hypothetical protein
VPRNLDGVMIATLKFMFILNMVSCLKKIKIRSSALHIMEASSKSFQPFSNIVPFVLVSNDYQLNIHI